MAHERVLRGTTYVCADCGTFLGDVRVAANFRKLRREPWAQTPENRAAIEMAERRYPHDTRVTPWLLREFRKQRLMLTPGWIDTVRAMQSAEQEGNPDLAREYSKALEGDRPDIVFFQNNGNPETDPPIQPDPVQPGMVQNLVKMLDHYRQRQSPLDIMGMEYPDVLPMYENWRSTTRERDPNSGEVVHAFPNGWTMRRLQDRNEIYDEGEEMRNCVPKYVNGIGEGTHHLFSLRDTKNNPHADVLMVPQNQGGHWDGGSVVDVRSRGNATPPPEYQRYIRNWFNTFNEPAKATFQPGPPGDPGPGDPDAYGLDNARYGRKRDQWTNVVEREPWIFTADRMEYLRDPKQRPDLQNEAARNWLHHLERTGIHSGDTDVLMPFLTKEWKAGRAVPTPNGIGFVKPESHEDIDTQAKELERNGYSPGLARLYANQHHSLGGEIGSNEVEKWGDFMRSNHSAKKGLDLNSRSTTWRDLFDRYKQYEGWMQKKKDRENTVHTDPDTGTYIKRLTPEECHGEGMTMNNCIKSLGYDNKIANKYSLLYSVRDKNGNPHIDMEVTPSWMHNPKTGNRMEWQPWYNWHRNNYGPYGTDENIAGNSDDYEPMPQQGKVIQIHGKNNAPPADHYQPMLKAWFGSKHFTGPEGEDWRPTWQLARTHFTDMDQLYSPVREHVTYYHPGDYGLEDPGVTSDYHHIVPTLVEDMRADPENKRVPFLTDWARRHGELDDLEAAVKDPAIEEHMKRYAPEPDPMDHPGYAQWLGANPEPTFDIPRPEGPRCPNCAVDGKMEALPEWVNGTPEIGCNWCGMHMNAEEYPELYQRIENWEPDQQQWQTTQQEHMQNIYQPWLAERNQRAEQAIQELAPAAWENSQPKAMLDGLQQNIDQARAGTPVVASYQIHTGKWTLVKTANKYNRLRNQLRKSDIWTPENEIIWNHLKAAYPNHEDLAEWLHREVRKERMESPGLTLFSTMKRHEKQAEDYQKHGDTLRERGEDDSAYQQAADKQWEAVSNAIDKMNDPEHLSKQYLSHYDPDLGKTTEMTPELLDEFQELIKKRKQRKQEANLMKIPTSELIQEAKEAEMSRRALQAGTVIHKFPDDWTIRHIDNAKEAQLESDMLGHCMNQYGSQIEAGTSHNYSLRDPKGLAHLSLEIKHTREPTVDWAGLRDVAQNQDFQCPNCGGKAVRGKCANCGFNVQDMQDWMEGDLETKAGIEGRLTDEPEPDEPAGDKLQYPLGDPRNDKCPHCGSRAKEFENNRIENHRVEQEGARGWFCMNCHEYYPPSRPLTDEEIDNHDGTRDMYVDDPIYQERAGGHINPPDKRLPGTWWDKLKPQLHDMKLMHPDLREGDAYQIQGKENIAPHPKYHRYLREWMGSIPYEERPKATWSSYFERTPVLHVDDLEDGGEKGIDDFGFQWKDRPYDWKSIVNSFHGDPKQWADRNSAQKKFMQEGDPEDKSYHPELGQEAYDFAKKNGYLPEVAKTIAPWGAPEYHPVRNMGDTPCINCGRRGMLSRDINNPDSVTCSWCGAKQHFDSYKDQVPEAPEAPPNYSPYQGALVQHLGPQLAEEPGMYEQVQDQFPKPGQNAACPRCGSFNVHNYPGEPDYMECGDCGRSFRKTTGSMIARHIGYHGQPCHCLWHKPDMQRLAKIAKVAKSDITKIADKFNDYLLNPQARPDLQEPDAQGFLQTLQNRYLTDKTDPLMPWLTREWKKGRVIHNPGPDEMNGTLQYEGPEEYGYEGPDGRPTSIHALRPDDLNHWADWYESNHPTRQGVDIMKLQTPDLVGRVRDWNNDMRDQAGGQAETKGQIEHSWPDGWTVQRLNKERQLKDEGEKMGHCVGGYWPSVRDGHTLIYSLRDHQNEPHATWEITPGGQHECAGCGRWQAPYKGKDPCVNCGYVGDTRPSPKNGEMVQVQGKNNEDPKDEYKDRIQAYYNTFPPGDLPTWESQYVDDADDFVDDDDGGGYTQYHHGDYGLAPPRMDVDWDSIWNSTEGRAGQHYRWVNPEQVVDKAVERDLLPELKAEFEPKIEEAKRDAYDSASDWWYENEHLFQNDYASYDPPPQLEDYEDETEYDEAMEKWEEERDEALQRERDERIQETMEEDDDYQKAEQYETAIANARYRHGSKKRRRYHSSFVTGQPCRCTFGRAQPETAAPVEDAGSSGTTAKTLTCEVCGNVLEGTHCPQCDWGGWSNAMGGDDEIPDPTRDLKPAIQASWETTMPESRWSTP